MNHTPSPYPLHLNVLALDIAQRCGWAHLAAGVITSGMQDCRKYEGCKSRPAEHDGQPFLNFHLWLREYLRDHRPVTIVYEKAMGHFQSAGAADMCIGMRGILFMQAAYLGIPVVPYSASTIKKKWTGTGRADKDQMVIEAYRRFPELAARHADDNECDAVATLHCHLEVTCETSSSPRELLSVQ